MKEELKLKYAKIALWTLVSIHIIIGAITTILLGEKYDITIPTTFKSLTLPPLLLIASIYITIKSNEVPFKRNHKLINMLIITSLFLVPVIYFFLLLLK